MSPPSDANRGAPRQWVPVVLSLIVIGATAYVAIARVDELTTMKLVDLATAFSGVVSALALLWLVWGYGLQAHGLDLQRRELAAQREELRLQRVEFVKMVEAQTVQGTETARLANAAAEQANLARQSIFNQDAPIIIAKRPELQISANLKQVYVALENAGGPMLDCVIAEVSEPWQAEHADEFGNIRGERSVMFYGGVGAEFPSFVIRGLDVRGRRLRVAFTLERGSYRTPGPILDQG